MPNFNLRLSIKISIFFCPYSKYTVLCLGVSRIRKTMLPIKNSQFAKYLILLFLWLKVAGVVVLLLWCNWHSDSAVIVTYSRQHKSRCVETATLRGICSNPHWASTSISSSSLEILVPEVESYSESLMYEVYVQNPCILGDISEKLP